MKAMVWLGIGWEYSGSYKRVKDYLKQKHFRNTHS